jgi:DNA-binding transcriptional LysR family regulator
MGGIEMESLELRIFRKVAREKSISKAAAKMGYVQSNITAHIHNLEEEIGVILFIRHSKGVTLTNEGKQLLVFADQIIALLNNAKLQFQKSEPTIKIWATQTIAAHRLPAMLSAYKKIYPSINFSVSTQPQSNLVESLADGKFDCAFINTALLDHPKLTSIFLFQEKLTFIAPKHLKPEEFVYQPIIVTNDLECPYRNLLESWIIKKTAKKPNIIGYDTLEGIIEAVSLGIGISLLPLSVLPQKSSDTYGFQIFQSSDVNKVDIHLVLPKVPNSVYLDQFVNIVKSCFS